MYVDLDGENLRNYQSGQENPADFDEFWKNTLSEARGFDIDVALVPVATGLVTVDVWDVTFSGFGGNRIRGWLRVPVGATGPLPTVVQFVGYGGGRGRATESLLWSAAGYAHFHMDTRGQGSTWSVGDTPDPQGSGPHHPGFVTKGIDSRESYYYRRLFTDAVRAIDAARGLPQVDASRVAVVGASQGGGIALAVAGLVPDLAAVAAFVPFLCDFPRATTITDADPYKEVGRYLATHRESVAAVQHTLAYFDGVNFARRASAPAWFSAGLMDAVCPPSTVFGAYNAYAGPKHISVWDYNGHEGGGPLDESVALNAFAGVFA
jgi:cephalosporin-C deacetylase